VLKGLKAQPLQIPNPDGMALGTGKTIAAQMTFAGNAKAGKTGLKFACRVHSYMSR